jgi:flavin reductase
LAGLTATSVSSLSLHPPSLIVCVNKAASAHDLLLRAGRFCVNILAAGATDAADVFADKERSADRFTTVPWSPGRSGVPVLDQSVAHFECRLGRTMDGFSHTVLIGIVLAANTTEGGMPLLYESGRYGAFRTL